MYTPSMPRILFIVYITCIRMLCLLRVHILRAYYVYLSRVLHIYYAYYARMLRLLHMHIIHHSPYVGEHVALKTFYCQLSS